MYFFLYILFYIQEIQNMKSFYIWNILYFILN